MNNDAIQKAFQTGVDQFSQMVTEVAGQLFNQTFSIKSNGSVVKDVNRKAKKANYPCVGIQFQTTGKTISKHLIEIPEEVALKLYASMIGKEPEEEVNTDILEGLQEGANQIFGQLQAAVDGQESQFSVTELSVSRLETGKELDTGAEGRGLDASHQVEAGDNKFELKHFIWISEIDQMDIAENESAVVDVHPAEFENFPEMDGGNGESHSIDMLLDVKLEILVQLGSKIMTIRDILKLGKGSVIELEKAAGEHLDIFVNQCKLAEGEVVVVDDHFGIRISQLLSPQERIKSLG